MKIEDLKLLIEQGEGLKLEFKENHNSDIFISKK